MAATIVDGAKVGLWNVLAVSESVKWRNARIPYWKCKCECGTEKDVRQDHLRGERTLSCGCRKFRCGPNHPLWTGHEGLSTTAWHAIVKAAEARTFCVEITIEQAWELFVSQKGKCALSGMPIDLASEIKSKRVWDTRTASLDRIDSTKGYISNNIQWVHKTINAMKMDLPEQDFKFWCKAVTEHNNKEVVL